MRNIFKEIKKYEHLPNIFKIDLYSLNSLPLRFLYKYIIKENDNVDGNLLDLGVYGGRSMIKIAVILKR